MAGEPAAVLIVALIRPSGGDDAAARAQSVVTGTAMVSARATRLAMPVAALMIAHQVAAKAVRDATFLSAMPASRLPAIVAATALFVVASVPIYSRLLERFGPRLVVSIGFLASALAHLLEWRFADRGSWVAVVVYLHVAGLTGLLLSGFWSLVSELFDPRTARAQFGRIAAVGTAGGLAGGLAAARIGDAFTTSDTLIFLAGLHVLCAAGVFAFDRQADAAVPPVRHAASDTGLKSMVQAAPHLRTLALIVVLGSAGATMLDYLLKREAVAFAGTGPALLQFFATFYVLVQVATFLAQFGVNAIVQRFGLGRTVSALPAGVVSFGALNLLYPTLPLLVAARGAEYVLRGSLFRSAYELVFVPMAPAEKRRAKTFLDVTCDRAGDILGAGVVQLFLMTSLAFVRSELLAVVIAMSVASLWLGRRLDALYLQMVERRLARHGEETPIVVQSETGWTVLDLPTPDRPTHAVRPDAIRAAAIVDKDPVLTRLGDLRSGDRDRVARALAALTRPASLEIAAVVQLLAWNDFVPQSRKVLTDAAASHIGLLTDALLDPNADFAIRRRIPRVLATVTSHRALAALVAGLDDSRFEVRFQCSAGMRRILARQSTLEVDRARILAVVEHELTAPLSVWHGHRLIDNVDDDDESGAQAIEAAHEHRNVEHVFSLLTAVLPAEPLRVAFQGIQTADATLRGVAVEYLESALPRSIWKELTRLLGEVPTPSSGGVRERSGPPPQATPR